MRGIKIKSEYILMLVVTFFWAVGHPLGRIILRQVHPFQLGAVNLTLGFISVLIYLLASGKIKQLKSFSAVDIFLSLLLGVFGFFFYQLCTFSALSRIPASMNAVLITTNVLFITLFSALFLREKIEIRQIAGIAIAAAGAVFVIFNDGFRMEGGFRYGGSIFSLLAALSFTVYSLGGKKLLSRRDPIVVVGLALFSGMVLLDGFTALTAGFSALISADGKTWLLMMLLSLGMIGLAYPVWFRCLKKTKAAEISIFIYMVPVFAGILSFLLLGERFAWRFYFGAALILGGIVTANLTRRGQGG